MSEINWAAGNLMFLLGDASARSHKFGGSEYDLWHRGEQIIRIRGNPTG